MDVLDERLGLEVIFLSTDLQVLASRSHLRLQPDIRQCVDGPQDFFDLGSAVKRLMVRNPRHVAPHLDRRAGIGFDEFIKSWYISRPSQVVFEKIPLHLKLGSEPASRFRVRVVLMTLQLERRPAAGAPFIAMVFHRQQPGDQIVPTVPNSARPDEQQVLDFNLIPNSLWSPPSSSAWMDDARDFILARTSTSNWMDSPSPRLTPAELLVPYHHYSVPALADSMIERTTSSVGVLDQDDVDYLNESVFDSVETPI